MKFQNAVLLSDKLSLMKTFIETFQKRAIEVDQLGSFPYRNMEQLVQSGYTQLTVPKRFGGEEISLYEFVRLQETLAMGDGSTALAIGWHIGLIQHIAGRNDWDPILFEKVIEDVKKGALINAAASEPQTGIPTRGGRPTTTAKKTGKGWVLNGRKTFTTCAPMLDYFIVSASIIGRNQVGNFLVRRNLLGVSIDESWDSISMRGTGSHDLVLVDVEVQEEDFIEVITPGKKGSSGYLLHIPACYLGIAAAASSYSVKFASTYAPNSLSGPIMEVPAVLQKIGEMELLLMESRHFLYSVAKQWDTSSKEEKNQMIPELSAVKHAVTNNALAIVDLAMRIVGARSLSQGNPLQRYYRDVRAGIHNPPMDDMTISILAKVAVDREKA